MENQFMHFFELEMQLGEQSNNRNAEFEVRVDIPDFFMLRFSLGNYLALNRSPLGWILWLQKRLHDWETNRGPSSDSKKTFGGSLFRVYAYWSSWWCPWRIKWPSTANSSSVDSPPSSGAPARTIGRACRNRRLKRNYGPSSSKRIKSRAGSCQSYRSWPGPGQSNYAGRPNGAGSVGRSFGECCGSWSIRRTRLSSDRVALN